MSVLRAGVPSVALASLLCAHGCTSHPPAATASTAPSASFASSRSFAPEATPAAAPHGLAPADVDARLAAAWASAGVTPTAPADDATWLRRAWIDALGTIPPADVVARFLADRAADKRARMVDEILASPLWADHWTAYWDDVWMGRDVREPDVDRGAFRAWLHDAFARNVPWNEVVTELLTATGRNSDGGPKRASEANLGDGKPPDGVNGAVNFTLKYRTNPQDMAGAASRTLLGIQIQCAQCHDHKTEKWTQHDFQAFAAAFVRTRLVPLDSGPPMGAVRRIDVWDMDRPAPRFGKMGDLEAIARARPAALDGTELGAGDGVRAALARWITTSSTDGTPSLARAFVNRMWGHFLGRGFVDPVDDLRPSLAVTAADVLGLVSADFAAGGYDIKRLVRLIVGTAGYARSAAPLDAATAKVDPDARLWERFRVTPLGPDELLNALVAATKLDAVVSANGRADIDQIRFRVRKRYGFLFDVDEESDRTEYEGTIAQSLALLNGSVVATGTSALPASALADVMAMPGPDAAKIDALYLRVLGRPPSLDEIDLWTKLVTAPAAPAPSSPPPAASPDAGPRPPAANAGPALPPDPLRGLENRAGRLREGARAHAYEDMLWALLNSSEFVLNH